MSTEDARKLFVAGLPDTITEDVLRQLFEATGGTVVDVSIPRDRATGKPRGFGFVTMSTSEQAAAARDSLDGSVQAGQSISVRPFQAEPPSARMRRAQALAGPTQCVRRTARCTSATCPMTARRTHWLDMIAAGVEGDLRGSIYPSVPTAVGEALAS